MSVFSWSDASSGIKCVWDEKKTKATMLHIWKNYFPGS